METEVGMADEVIMNKIYMIRGHKIMIGSDLAHLYGVETKRINEQVKRNLERFPNDFMFQLSENEQEILKSQFATSRWGGKRKPSYAFTEHGVLMLSSVLNSKKAIEVNIQIIRIFIRVRQMLTDNSELRLTIQDLKEQTQDNTKNIDLLFKHLDKFLKVPVEEIPIKKIGYEMPTN
jgi:phage regulator Rha-like protein